ncbi:fimbrial protein [Lelliottia sp. CFBP8978]|uniref:fimbrial protein n=1 Tax=Lelliottia sp. CFBP8978 TaxID=3096522 RepID=UPI002A6AECED|nr:fimbrial protein [Lelliottia sp. CFBP8978]MDY1035610.1 fimbrial protein [Lelliottia sp. CFBP8978]
MSKLKTTACAIALSMISAYTFAGDSAVTQGTVTFNGKLIAETCSIVSGDEEKQVTLPTLSVQSLVKAGDEAGTTRFSLTAEDCPATITQVAAHFEAINSTGFDATTQNLTNSATTNAAKNVEVRLYDTDASTQLPLGTTGSFFPVDSTTQKATMTYVGGYYATGATAAGDVTAQVQYTLAYK